MSTIDFRGERAGSRCDGNVVSGSTGFGRECDDDPLSAARAHLLDHMEDAHSERYTSTIARPPSSGS